MFSGFNLEDFMQIKLFAGTWVTSNEVKLKRKNWFCSRCKKEQKAFTAPGLAVPSMRKIIFCCKCKGIVSKPKRLERYTSPQTSVTIHFEDGGREETSHDYAVDPYRVPLVLTHRCFSGLEVDLCKYQRRVKRDHGEEETLEQYYECPVCLQEKLLKHREVKVTLLNFQKILENKSSLVLH